MYSESLVCSRIELAEHGEFWCLVELEERLKLRHEVHLTAAVEDVHTFLRGE